jgi:cell wall-associated NlpC family hydrolase
MPVPALVAVITRKTLVNAVVLLMAAVCLVATPGHGRTADSAPMVETKVKHVSSATKVLSALRVARNQKGDPYRYGAAGPGAFDCSGLVYYSTRRAGFRNVPRTSSAQSRFMRHIKRSAMRPGDFVFFNDGGGVYHVGVFSGWKNGRRLIVHAPYTGARVRTEAIWTNRWFPGTLRGR